MSGEKNPKIAVDVGLSAKASLEAKISTEIPAQSTGRLLDAVTDIFRPFSERRGLKADLIRLQREDVLLEIARKATARLEIENRQPAQIPNKFLVPFLEKASLEEAESALIDRWVDLLVSSTIDPAVAHPRFVQILSEITPAEAQLLRAVALNNVNLKTPNSMSLEATSREFSPEHMDMEFLLKSCLHETGELSTIIRDFQKSMMKMFSFPGCAIINVMMGYVKEANGRMAAEDILNQNKSPIDIKKPCHRSSLDILISLNLLRELRKEIDDDRFVFIQVAYVCITPLAVQFLEKCDRDVEQYLRSVR